MQVVTDFEWALIGAVQLRVPLQAGSVSCDAAALHHPGIRSKISDGAAVLTCLQSSLSTRSASMALCGLMGMFVDAEKPSVSPSTARNG
ncbi:hypothetical protein PybrP1_001647 [[Pythium] brassicae (nom. inval.)]|nr:hypothetical protein PybrP1_001647 [[Pythium] brassicae (nom. inval.)]